MDAEIATEAADLCASDSVVACGAVPARAGEVCRDMPDSIPGKGHEHDPDPDQNRQDHQLAGPQPSGCPSATRRDPHDAERRGGARALRGREVPHRVRFRIHASLMTGSHLRLHSIAVRSTTGPLGVQIRFNRARRADEGKSAVPCRGPLDPIGVGAQRMN